MKKLIVIALAVVMALSVVALAACGGEQVLEGEYSYFAWDYATGAVSTTHQYGCKVKVTVKGGVITNVEVTDDTESFYNLTSSWTDKATWEEGQEAMVKSFIGLTVDQVKEIKVATNPTLVTEPYVTPAGQPTGITGAPEALKTVAGATQSSGRLILAVQNALSQLDK